MRQILNVNIPKSWQELPDRELRFVFRLLQGEYSLTQIKTLCLLRWGQLKVVRRERLRVGERSSGMGAVFIVRHHKKNYPLTALQITESTEALAWLGDFPQYPVRLSRIGIYRPVRADFQNVSFGDFLALDNLYQGYLQTQREELLHDMALVIKTEVTLVTKSVTKRPIMSFFAFLSFVCILAG